MKTTVTFLGLADVIPGIGEDTASFVINGNLLVDCGWQAPLKMQQYGLNPLELDTLFFTHCHHDHVMGLPALLFYRGMRATNAGGKNGPLRIIGPPDDLPIIVEAARNFLQAKRFPEIWSEPELVLLEPGESFETEEWRIETVHSLHPVTGYCSRFTDKQSGAVVAFSGDTAPNDAFAPLVRNADLLVHEASMRPEATMTSQRHGHSRSIDAAQLAKETNAKELRLIHLTRHREASLEAARAIFANTHLANEGETVELP